MPTGLAGSSPFQLHPKLINTILMDSVKAKWATYCTNPSVSEITWWDVEPPTENDVAISFEMMDEVVDWNSVPIGWNRERMLGYVTIHVYANHTTIEEQPPYIINIVNAIKTMIMTERKALVPNSEFVRIDRIFPVPKESKLQRRWHWYCSVMVAYTEVLTS